MRLGLIGAGRWGKRYIATINQIPGIALSHLASRNPESRQLIRSGCKLTADWRDVATSRELDGIILATPPSTHFEMAVAAIQTGVPVLIEKPMTLSVEEAHALVKTAIEHKVLVMVGHTHLYSAAFRRLMAQGESLGQLLEVRSTGSNWGPFRPDTPMMWDWAPHDLAMCLELFGSVPPSIDAERTAVITTSEGIGETVEIALGFESGGRAEVLVSNIDNRKHRFLEVRYARGILIYDDLADNKLTLQIDSAGTPQVLPVDGTLPLTNLVNEFCQAIISEGHASSSLLLGRRVVEVLASCQARLDAVQYATGRPPNRFRKC